MLEEDRWSEMEKEAEMEESWAKTETQRSLIKRITARCLTVWLWIEQSRSALYYSHCSDAGPQQASVFRAPLRWSYSSLLMLWNKSGCCETNTGYVDFSKPQNNIQLTYTYLEAGDTFFIMLILRVTATTEIPLKNTGVLPAPVTGATGLKTPSHKAVAQPTRN